MRHSTGWVVGIGKAEGKTGTGVAARVSTWGGAPQWIFVHTLEEPEDIDRQADHQRSSFWIHQINDHVICIVGAGTLEDWQGEGSKTLHRM